MYSEKSIHEYEKSPYCIYSGKSSSYSKNTLIDCVCVSVSMLGGGGGHRYDCTICSSKRFKSTWVVIFFHNMYGCVFNMRVLDIFPVYGVCI